LRVAYKNNTPNKPLKINNEDPVWWNPEIGKLRKEMRIAYKHAEKSGRGVDEWNLLTKVLRKRH
jgi:hypothetical protein